MWRTIILLFFSLPLSGQQGMLLVGGGDGEVNYILDSFPGAQAAFAYHKLSSDYTGFCVEVVNSNGSDSLNIGFLASGIIDTTSLDSFCSGLCRVKTWYDQSGNGNNAVSSNLTNGPIIVSSSGNRVGFNNSSLYTSAYFNDANRLSIGPLSAFHPDSTGSVFSVSESNASARLNVVLTTITSLSNGIAVYHDTRATPNRNLFIRTSSGTFAADLSAARVTTDPFLLSHIRIGATGAMSAFDNGGGTDTYTGAFTSNSTVIGYQSVGPLASDIRIAMILIYNSDQSANRTDIETDINNYYSIY